MITPAGLIDRMLPSHRLLLSAALGSPEQAGRAWAQWCCLVDFDDVDGPSMRLLPLLARRPDVVGADDPLHGRVRGLYRRAWVANEQLFAVTRTALSALADRGVAVLHVEARPLSSVYAEHATRPLHDIDFCVRRNDRARALGVLHDLGWSAAPQTLRARWERRPLHLVHGEGRIRLILGTPWPGADDSCWRESVGGELDNERHLCAGDLFVHAAMRAVQPWQQPSVQWVVDMAHLAAASDHDRLTSVLDDKMILGRARAHRAEDVLRAAVHAAASIAEGSGTH